MYTSKIQLVMVVVYIHQQDTVSDGGVCIYTSKLQLVMVVYVYTPASYS